MPRDVTFFVDLDDPVDRFEFKLIDAVARGSFQVAADRSLSRRVPRPVRPTYPENNTQSRKATLLQIDFVTDEIARDAFPILVVDVPPRVRVSRSLTALVYPWKHTQSDFDRIIFVGWLQLGYLEPPLRRAGSVPDVRRLFIVPGS